MMDPNKTVEARAILAAVVQEQKNWEAARLRVGEVLETYDKAQEELGALDNRRNDLKQAIANLERDLHLGTNAMEKEIANRRAALLQELHEEQTRLENAKMAADAADSIAKTANVKAKEAEAKQSAAEEDLERINHRVEEARELLAKLRTVGG